MADEKTPRPKIELEGKEERPEAPAPDDGSARLFAWVRRTFPGHEHAFWGGVLGFVAAILFLVLGLFKALVIVLLVIVGVAAGQALDGDSKIMDLVRRLFSNN